MIALIVLSVFFPHENPTCSWMQAERGILHVREMQLPCETHWKMPIVQCVLQEIRSGILPEDRVPSVVHNEICSVFISYEYLPHDFLSIPCGRDAQEGRKKPLCILELL